MSSSPYLKKVLDNGITIVAEKIDTVQSIALGMFVHSGVIYEVDKMHGVSHFIEHMLFKGTVKRSAKKIASEFDRIGGVLNAFTSKDFCCYYARVVKDKLEKAIDVLGDMIMNSQFPQDEIERERRVILEEIKMYEDSPDEIIHELLGQNIWKKAKLGRPILGTKRTVGAMTRDDIYEVFETQYVTENLLICIAGNFDWDKLCSLIDRKLKNMRKGSFNHKLQKIKPSSDASVYVKNMEQVHLTLGTEGVSFSDDRRFALTILNAALGGGMSSRLFQEVREKRGLAYTVYSYHTSLANTGLFGIYAGTSMNQLPMVLEVCRKEMEKFKDKGISTRELNATREQLEGNMLLGLESMTNRMNRLSMGFLYNVEPLAPEDTLAPYLAVTTDEVNKLAQDLLDEKRLAITIIAPTADIGPILEQSGYSKRKIEILKAERIEQ